MQDLELDLDGEPLTVGGGVGGPVASDKRAGQPEAASAHEQPHSNGQGSEQV